MGGELVWTPVRTNSDDEHEESWAKLNTAGDGEDPNNCWYYRPSSFHQLKGLAMRAGIQYLESIQHQVDERKSSGSGADVDSVAGSRQFLSDAGILAAAGSPTDSRALADASTVIPKAVRLLRSWLREQVLDAESGQPELAFVSLTRKFNVPPGGTSESTGGLPLEGLSAAGAGVTMEDMLNMNFLISEVQKHECCPAALHRVGLGGLYYFAKLADNHQFIYPFEARVLAATLTRLLDFLPADTLDWKETAGELRDLLHKCGEDEMTMIQG